MMYDQNDFTETKLNIFKKFFDPEYIHLKPTVSFLSGEIFNMRYDLDYYINYDEFEMIDAYGFDTATSKELFKKVERSQILAYNYNFIKLDYMLTKFFNNNEAASLSISYGKVTLNINKILKSCKKNKSGIHQTKFEEVKTFIVYVDEEREMPPHVFLEKDISFDNMCHFKEIINFLKPYREEI